MTQSSDMCVWPKELLFNKAYAAALSCIKCHEMPTASMTNEEGEILCNQCAQDMDSITENKAVQKMINRLKTKCLSLKRDDTTNAKEGSDQCKWTGMIPEWQQHQKECMFLVIPCEKCKTFQSQRKSMPNHLKECPEATVSCPLSCGSMIIRKKIQSHLKNACNEQLLDCTNDDCKQQIKRKDFDRHIKNECDGRIIGCEFAKYGCTVKGIRANEMKKHLEDYKFDHLSQKIDYFTNQPKNQIVTQGVESSIWRHCVYSNTSTGIIVGDKKERCVIYMTLPQKAGKYVCRYSFIGFAEEYAENTRFIWYYFRLGRDNLLGQDGSYLPKGSDDTDGFPLSGTVIAELTGNETISQRKLGLYHYGTTEYPSGMKKMCIECYELNDSEDDDESSSSTDIE